MYSPLTAGVVGVVGPVGGVTPVGAVWPAVSPRRTRLQPVPRTGRWLFCQWCFFLHGLLSIAGSASDSPAPTPLAWASRLRLEPKETPSSLMTADTTTATR